MSRRIVRPHRCCSCNQETPAHFDQCPRCGAWGTAFAAELARRDAGPRQRLADVLPAPTVWLPCEPSWRAALGGGVPEGGTILVHGRAGLGKTTELLRLVGTIPGSLFATCEPGMSPSKLREYAERAQLAIPHVWVTQADALGPLCAELQSPPRPSVAVVDSASVFDVPELVALKALRRALGPRPALFCVVHVTKGGDMAGAEALRHYCDATIRLEADAFVTEKTRYGGPERAPRAPRHLASG